MAPHDHSTMDTGTTTMDHSDMDMGMGMGSSNTTGASSLMRTSCPRNPIRLPSIAAKKKTEANFAPAMSMMSMTFFTSTEAPLYSDSWTPRSLGQYAGTCIFLI